jgi:hypothetical protein
MNVIFCWYIVIRMHFQALKYLFQFCNSVILNAGSTQELTVSEVSIKFICYFCFYGSS